MGAGEKFGVGLIAAIAAVLAALVVAAIVVVVILCRRGRNETWTSGEELDAVGRHNEPFEMPVSWGEHTGPCNEYENPATIMEPTLDIGPDSSASDDSSDLFVALGE
jgi:hypothetical protein